MLKRQVFLLLLVPFLFASKPAHADDPVTVSFSAGLAGFIANPVGGVFRGSYFESGFQFDIYGDAPTFIANGTGHMLGIHLNNDILIFRQDGGIFDFVSLNFPGGGDTSLRGFHPGNPDPDVFIHLTGLGGTVHGLASDPAWGGINGMRWCGYCISGFVPENSITSMTFNVAAVPEPEVYAMMMVGLPLLGFMARRKKKLQQAAVV